MNVYSIFKRVPGTHPRWHRIGQIEAASRPAALRAYGIPAPPRQECVMTDRGLFLAWKTDAIDFDFIDAVNS